MVSQRHKGIPGDELLEIARECVIDLGWKHTTITEVARRAGVSRMTLYRKWPDMDRMGAELMLREWRQVRSGLEVRATNPREQLVETLVLGATTLRENEMFRRIIALDPEALIPYVFRRLSRSHREILELVTAAVSAGQDAGDIRQGAPVVIARALVLVTQSFAFSVDTMVDDDVSREALDDELRTVLTRSLLP